MQYFLLYYTKSDNFFPQKSVSLSYVKEKQELSFSVCSSLHNNYISI